LNGKQRLERSHENPREAEAATDGKVFIEGAEAARCANETKARKETGVKRIAQGLVGHAVLLKLPGENELHIMLKFIPSLRGECRMDINELLEDAKDEPAGVTARSADGRLFFIPDSETERFAIQDSGLYRAFIAAGGRTFSAKSDSLYPCVLAADWLGSHSPRSAKWRRICLEYFDNC
jgi:hypothetical protein